MRKKFLLLIILVFSIISQSVFAVSNTILLGQAKSYTNEHLYNESIMTLEQILNNTPEAEIKREVMYLMVENYKNLEDVDNAIKYQNEVINIEKQMYKNTSYNRINKESIFHRLTAAYLNQMLFLSYKLNDTYIKSKQLDNVIINDITKIIYEIDKNTLYIDCYNHEWDSTEFFEEYALDILYSKDIDSILKFRLTNMVLPFLTKRECAKDCDSRGCGCPRTTLPFFRVYSVLLNKILETEDNEFIAAGTTKEKVLDVIKTKKSALTNDYDKDLFEALNYYYLGDTEKAKELKNLIKYNYYKKYKYSKDLYKEHCHSSMTDYVFKEVQSYVSKYCPQKKKQKKKR